MVPFDILETVHPVPNMPQRALNWLIHISLRLFSTTVIWRVLKKYRRPQEISIFMPTVNYLQAADCEHDAAEGAEKNEGWTTETARSAYDWLIILSLHTDYPNPHNCYLKRPKAISKAIGEYDYAPVNYL